MPQEQGAAVGVEPAGRMETAVSEDFSQAAEGVVLGVAATVAAQRVGKIPPAAPLVELEGTISAGRGAVRPREATGPMEGVAAGAIMGKMAAWGATGRTLMGAQSAAAVEAVVVAAPAISVPQGASTEEVAAALVMVEAPRATLAPKASWW